VTARARAILLGDRLLPDRAAQPRIVSTAPFCFRKGDGYIVAFRYGVVVLIGLTPAEEDENLSHLADNATPTGVREEERIVWSSCPTRRKG
jgi:hypothetical protein